MSGKQDETWLYRIDGFNREDILHNGNRFLISNGYLGYRGTMEEFTAAEQTACVLNGVYDRQANEPREPVNMPNGLYIMASVNGHQLSCAGSSAPGAHVQEIDLRQALHRRCTTFQVDEVEVRIEAERFAAQDRPNLLCLRFSITTSTDAGVVLHTGIDPQVWDLHGPHFSAALPDPAARDCLLWTGETLESGIALACCECADLSGLPAAEVAGGGLERTIRFQARAGQTCVLDKFFTVFTGLDGAEAGPAAAAEALAQAALQAGYEDVRAAHIRQWERIWDASDVVIEGDAESCLALRYSLYQLHSAAPRHSGRVSIPARALSGQVYRGAVFWDTEMFMTPVFNLVDPLTARNLLLYRYHTLPGARRKAASYGFRGAFYAWEGQEDGEDACGILNIIDVNTGRPMRTYFRDKQIHVSAAVALAFRDYLNWTGDTSILAEGGLEVLVECARFYYSRACWMPERGRYELWDVVGPDEYHERVHNNAYTNQVVRAAVETLLQALDQLETASPAIRKSLGESLGFASEIDGWRDLRDRLYQPEPDPATGLIPQFEGYPELEDTTPAELKKRALQPNEYFGGGQGIATTTQVIKQADVVLMLALFRHLQPGDILLRNWQYYLARTEHGSSLSASSYGILGARLGRTEEALEFFLKTATVDLTGKSKQFVGKEYIGGTHPAANGGAYMVTIFGMAGVSLNGDLLEIDPHLPPRWTALRFSLQWQGNRIQVVVTPDQVVVKAAPDNPRAVRLKLPDGELISCQPGGSVESKAKSS